MPPKQLALCTSVPTRHGSAGCRFRPPSECEYEPVSGRLGAFAGQRGWGNDTVPITLQHVLASPQTTASPYAPARSILHIALQYMYSKCKERHITARLGKIEDVSGLYL
ncbi:hypothetical protein TgHK011_002985 [Trichoderma gracile]|nr:hypothetical protein TgHK011_002985 [Trichoderma gracile]